MFRTVPLSIIRSYSLYTQHWYMSYRFVDSFRAAAGSGWNCSSILILLLLLESCLQTCMGRIRMELQFHPDPAVAARKLSTNLYDIYQC
jgi:hypothetical protein